MWIEIIVVEKKLVRIIEAHINEKKETTLQSFTYEQLRFTATC